MQAQLNYDVARKIIEGGLWPDLSAEKHKQPCITPVSGIIKFFAWHEGSDKQHPAGFIYTNGRFNGAGRNVRTMQTLATAEGLDLECTIFPPQPPTHKTVKPKAEKPKVPKEPKKTAPASKPKTEKAPLSISEMLKARKAGSRNP